MFSLSGLSASLSLLVFAQNALSQIPQRNPLNQDFNFIGNNFGIIGLNASFDYVVIGGGTAGLAMATRLAQAQNSVAVVEAGGFYEMDNSNLSVVPSDVTWFSGTSPDDYNPLVDWGFVTVPQTAANNRIIHYTRGKTFGGSSARNYLAYQRGTSESYDVWADEVGDQSYTFANWKPYFDKAVNFTFSNTALRAQNVSVPPPSPGAFSGEPGPVHVSYPNWGNPFSSWVARGMASLGLSFISDFVNGKIIGMQYNMLTLDPTQEIRATSETGYMRIALNTGLPVAYYKSTMVKRITFANGAANGVIVQTGPKTWSLSAKKEVIVSAGAFQSPQILMASGIGPQDTLAQYGIDCVSHLPGVGQNMWDHILYGPSYTVNNLITHSSLITNPQYAAEQYQNYVTSQTGPIGNTGGDFFAFEKLPQPDRSALSPDSTNKLGQFPEDWPELEYLFFDAYLGNQQNYVLGSPQDQRQYAAPFAALVAPLSRGNVTISSADTNVPPVINPNWLSDPADQELAVASFKRMRNLMDSQPLQSITGEEVFPGRNVSSDADILESIKNSFNTVYHACCTSKMGQRNDSLAVVDTLARVYGVQNLRVVDVSTFPILPPGHPQSTVYGLAEKIADAIVKGTQ